MVEGSLTTPIRRTRIQPVLLHQMIEYVDIVTGLDTSGVARDTRDSDSEYLEAPTSELTSGRVVAWRFPPRTKGSQTPSFASFSY